MATGTVFNIQHYSVHDGFGIRTIVFLKGCPLHCLWCSNPEGKETEPQLAYNPTKCIGGVCKMCLKKCSGDYISWSEEADRPIIDFTRLDDGALELAKYCPAKALSVYGQAMTAEEVVAEVEKDSVFYARSGGGVTFSGGEPLLQADFLLACLTLCEQRGIHTGIETTLHAPWEKVQPIIEKLDHAYIDIKHINPEKHKQYTGVDNTMILENLKKIGELYPDKPIRLRTPVIPTFNDTEEELLAIRAFIDEYLPNAEYEILRYHSFGKNKYDFIGQTFKIPDHVILEEEKFEQFKQLVRSI